MEEISSDRSKYDSVAQRFRTAAITAPFEAQTYYALQTECTNMLPDATSHASLVLFLTACLAERLAKILDNGGIDAEGEGHWASYADTLEQLVRTAGYDSWSAQEIQ